MKVILLSPRRKGLYPTTMSICLSVRLSVVSAAQRQQPPRSFLLREPFVSFMVAAGAYFGAHKCATLVIFHGLCEHMHCLFQFSYIFSQ